MKFTGQIRVPEVDHPGVPATFLIEDVQVEVVVDDESLGRWSLFDVQARRLVSSAFQVELEGEEITFLADDPIDFAYRGVEHMAEVWARFKAMNLARRPVAVHRSRKGASPSKIPELRDAMLENLQSERNGFLTGKESGKQDDITAESVAQELEALSAADSSVELAETGDYPEIPVVGETTGDELNRLESRRAEAERQEHQRVEAERLEAEKHAFEEERAKLEEEKRSLQAERELSDQKEADRVKAFRLEMDRLEAEREEQESLEGERAEAFRLEMAKLRAERDELGRLEDERTKREGLEADRLKATRVEAKALEQKRADIERLEAEHAEAARQELESIENKRKEIERLDAERSLQQQEDNERLEAERLEAASAEAREAIPEDEPPTIVEEILSTSGDSDDSEASKQLVVDLGKFEESGTEPEPDSEPGSQPEPVLAGVPREKSGIMGAVKSAFTRNGRNHVHEFVEAPGGIGIGRSICEECGYVSISAAD